MSEPSSDTYEMSLYNKQSKLLKIDEDKDFNLLFKQVLDIVELVCYPKEKQSIYEILNCDNFTEKYPRYETHKANRRNGILKVIKYLKEQNGI